MYIKSMVIDGFKSYAQRTEVNGFDPLFNAITGLNGSGKSNILDAICFLLGISNLTQVRASNLQELVYKNGQAGVTKATVDIVFDNSNKNQSPLGYEQYDEITVTRQVVIGGRNKYLINGSNANNTRVQDLFRSVQLNINNPHFLIMQGRITKVLNMKPPEILSMIEEAAGTRLYESKKELAQKTIEKKDARLKEIDTILEEEITPTLHRLKDERSSYLEYQKIIRELEHLNKLYIAYQFVCAQENSEKSTNDLVQLEETIKKLNDRQKQIETEVNEMDKEIKKLEQKRDQEAGGVMEKLESELSEIQKVDAKANSVLNNKKDLLKEEKKKLAQVKKQHTTDDNSSKGKRKEEEKLISLVTKMESEHNANEEACEEAKKHFHAVSAGLSSNDGGDDASLNDQLMNAKKVISDCDTQRKQAHMTLKHAVAEVKRREADLKKTESSYKKDESAYKQVKVNLDKLKSELEKIDYQDGYEEELSEKRRELTQKFRNLRETVDTLNARFPQLRFDYRDPEKNFDRSKVHGLVARLIKIKDVSTATALEVSAGGKLYNVVVDTEQTGKKLLEKGELQRRYTIIPLNKISAQSINPHVVQKAENLVGKNNVFTALTLIGFENQLQKAMEFVFGSAFVCTSMDAAKKVTFDPSIMKKSVTLDGDSFDPAGLLTGGARAQTSSILTKLEEVNDAQEQLNSIELELQNTDRELTQVSKLASRWRQTKQQYELKLSEVELLESRLKQSTHHQQLEEIDTLKKSITEQEVVLTESDAKSQESSKKAAELESKIKNAKSIREKELKDAEKAVKDSKTKSDASRKLMKEKQNEVESISLEIAELEKEVLKAEEEMKLIDVAITKIEEEIQKLNDEASETKSAVKEAQQKVTDQKELLKACNKDIGNMVNQQKSLLKEASAAQLETKEMEYKITKCQKDAKESSKQVELYIQKYTWIEEEKKYFGQSNTAYDFNVTNPKEAGKRMEKLTETKEKLSKSVNMRAMSMLGKAEEQYNDLIHKRTVVLNDKAKIASVIKELDEKKNEALRKAHGQVNKDFGSIFSTLLPGTQAKLKAPDGKTILDGLEVKVAFGDVWKDSLNELSGGQRSLVALSLILSLLLFKPAPLYILDEVDAALDLSHTQNIGQMLRTHFTHSQFIVVSLKDGMFNNANVLFKTKFVDGVSTVTRFTQQQPTRVLSSSNNVNIPSKDKSKKKKARNDTLS